MSHEERQAAITSLVKAVGGPLLAVMPDNLTIALWVGAPTGEAAYASNADRGDMIALVEEWLDTVRQRPEGAS